jgi:hypothetical protein
VKGSMTELYEYIKIMIGGWHGFSWRESIGQETSILDTVLRT